MVALTDGPIWKNITQGLNTGYHEVRDTLLFDCLWILHCVIGNLHRGKRRCNTYSWKSRKYVPFLVKIN